MRLNPLSLNPRLLLYLSVAGASCALHRRGRLEGIQSLPEGEEGWEIFNGHLLRHPGLPVAIAVDTVDELYRPERLPRVRGLDRREMIERRLRQMIHHSPYRAALRQGPDEGDARQERYLMMGLANPDLLRPWLDIVHLRGSYLAGIWLLPSLAVPLARHLGLEGSLLLVSEQTGGLRLTYLDHGALRFSRLAPVDGSQYRNPLESYAAEIERTRQALVGQRLLERAAPLLLDPLDTLAELSAFLPESEGFLCESVNRPQLLDTLNLPPSLLAESTDALYLRLLVAAPPSANLMNREQREETRIRWWSRGLRYIAGTWMGLSLLFSAGLLLDAWHLDGQADGLRAATRRHAEAEAGALAAAGGIDQVRRHLGAVHAWRVLEAGDRSPVPGARAALDAAAATGNARLLRIEWDNPPPPSDARLGLEGELVPFDSDFDAAQRRVQRLRDLLQARLPGLQATVRRWPLDSAPEQGLQGEFGHSRPQARFAIDARGKP